MYLRISLIILLGLMTSACAPYNGGSYYRTEVYTVDSYPVPGYYRGDRYYVAPQPRYYYSPAPRYYPAGPGYYRLSPAPRYRPGPPPLPPPGVILWQDGRRNDYGHRQRYDYGRDRDRDDYRQDPRRGGGPGGWHPPGPPGPDGPRWRP